MPDCHCVRTMDEASEARPVLELGRFSGAELLVILPGIWVPKGHNNSIALDSLLAIKSAASIPPGRSPKKQVATENA